MLYLCLLPHKGRKTYSSSPWVCLSLHLSNWPLQNVTNLVNATPPTVLAGFFKTYKVFLSRSEDVTDVWL